jgi:hypothetical protein
MTLAFQVGFILVSTSLISTLIDYRYSLKFTLIALLSGVFILVGFSLWMNTLQLFPLTKNYLFFASIVPTYLLMVWLSKIRDLRFTYTFVLGISFTILVGTLVTYIYKISYCLWAAEMLAATIALLMVVFLLVYVRSSYLEAINTQTRQWKRIVTIPMLSLVIIFLMTDEALQPGIENAYLEISLVIYTIMIISHVYAYLYFLSFLNVTLLEKNNRVLEKLLDSMRSNLNDQIESIKLNRQHRHDFHHHLSVLSTLAHSSNLKEFDAYVENLNERLSETIVFAFSNNFNLNAVLSVYLQKANEAQIRCTHEISLSESFPFDEIELGLILANGIENAINANMKILDLNHRFIDLKINTDHHYLTILIQNPIEVPLEFKDGLPLSKNLGHGFGTLGIKSLAQKFKGIALFSVEKGKFSLIVQLPLID